VRLAHTKQFFISAFDLGQLVHNLYALFAELLAKKSRVFAPLCRRPTAFGFAFGWR
jgi:hypothetical protein